jgi:NAD(P)-dependent dehydrogenase (short-subunit alcohol dehydrogenase family)
MRELKGRVAVVTGGGSGIGRGLCRAFAAEGMAVAVADVDRASAEETAAALRQGGARAIAVHTDVSDRKSVQDLAERVARDLGGVHLVCNNAGVCVGGRPLEHTEADWRWLLGVNLMGVVHGCHVFAPRLVAQGEGHLVNTASVGGLLAGPDLDVYCATKFAVVGFSEALRAELAPRGVGVSILCPGPVATRLAESERLRPRGLGASGGSSGVLTPLIEGGMDPIEVAKLVLAGVRSDAEYIFTHPEFRELLAQRFGRVLAAFDALPAAGGTER